MSDDRFRATKDEIAFFMDKLFQTSFVYIAALFAAAATTTLDGTRALATALDTSSRAIVVTAVLTANLVFLVLACSCTFAVLKRGMFILESDQKNDSSLDVRWEIFVRHTGRPWSDLSWNVDNYYVGVLGLFVFGASLATGIFGLATLGTGERLLVALLLTLHAIPVWMLWQVARLNTACRELIATKYNADPHDQPRQPAGAAEARVAP